MLFLDTRKSKKILNLFFVFLLYPVKVVTYSELETEMVSFHLMAHNYKIFRGGNMEKKRR